MQRTRGFTLVELAIGLFILGVVGTVAYQIMHRTTNTYKLHRDVTETTQNARLAMETITTDLRQVSYGKDVTQASIVHASLDSIVFIADFYDSIPGAETVALYLTAHLDSGTRNPSDRLVYRAVSDTSGSVIEEGPVAYGVADSGLTFLYFDRDGAAMSFPIVQPEHIAEIEIAVTTQTAHYEQGIGYRDVTLTNIVYPRNLPFSPPRARPNSPGCVSLTSPNCGSLTAKWTRPTSNTDGSELKFNDVSHFTVYYGTHPDSMKMDTRLARNLDEWTVKDLTAGNTYRIAVTVTTQAGIESEACLQIGAVGTTAPPKAPGGFSGLGGPSGMNLSWSPVTQDSANVAITAQVLYDLYRSTSPVFPLDGTTEVVNGWIDSTYFDAIIDTCNTYYYAVRARACGVNGIPSTVIGVSTAPPPSCPSAVDAYEGTLSGNITVTWSPPTTRADGSPLTTGEIKGFYVYWSLTSGSYTDSVYVSGGTSNLHDLLGLAFCQTFYANVRAVDQCGNTGSVCVNLEGVARTKAPCNALPPQPVSNVAVVGGSERVDITFNPNTFDCDLDGYYIYYGTSSGDLFGTGATQGPSPIYVDAASVQLDTSNAAYSLTGLSACLEYFITITSVDNCSPANQSSYSTEESDFVLCTSCDLSKGCVTEVAEGNFQERLVFDVANDAGSDVLVDEMEITWTSGVQLVEILVENISLWTGTGNSGDNFDVTDFLLYDFENFDYPVPMTLVFTGSINGDMVDVSYSTDQGQCTLELNPCGIMFADAINYGDQNGVPGWTPRTGSWEVDGNAMYNGEDGRITPDAFGFANTDYTAEMDVRGNSGRSNARVGLYVRYQDTGNYYLVRYYPNLGTLQFLKKVGSGSLITIEDTYIGSLVTNGWVNIKISALGSQFRVWIDGAIIDWPGTGTVIADGSLPTGNICTYAWNVDDAWFDNARVDPTCGCGGIIP